eukprot:g78422.t1
MERALAPPGTRKLWLYLHDASLNHYCPELASKLRLPKYFPYDLRKLNREPSREGRLAKESNHPGIFIRKKSCSFFKAAEEEGVKDKGIFIGKVGSGSPLHADSKCTRFYMYMLSGKKWRLAPPSENWRLGPKYHKRDWYPLLFEADLMNPDFERFPDLDGALVYETELKAGEVLFVPEMWAHQVVNLDDSVSTSLNWVDKDMLPNWNMDHVHRVRYMPLEEAERASTLSKHMNSFMTDLPHPNPNATSIAWLDWFRAHELQHAPVPWGLYAWLGSHHVDERIDEHFLTPLHMAVSLNMLEAAQFLVYERGADVNLKDAHGMRPRDVANYLDRPQMAEFLRHIDLSRHPAYQNAHKKQTAGWYQLLIQWRF